VLLDGEINLFHCQHCHKQMIVDRSLFYVDTETQYSARYWPPAVLDDARFYTMLTPDGQMALRGRLGDGMPRFLAQSHVVFSMRELVHYITFRDQLWERS
jgi:hypothetical protein